MIKTVPFGKYKGQPVEAMQADAEYCEWLTGQDWFRERYATIYSVIVNNNFGEPSETPEHNAMQARFQKSFATVIPRHSPTAADISRH